MDAWLGALFLLSVWFDGVPATCVVDTGANASFIRASLAAKIGTLGPAVSENTTTLPNDTRIVSTSHVVPNFGTQAFGLPEAHIRVVPDAQLVTTECLIGMNVLRRASLLFILTPNPELDASLLSRAGRFGTPAAR